MNNVSNIKTVVILANAGRVFNQPLRSPVNFVEKTPTETRRKDTIFASYIDR